MPADVTANARCDVREHRRRIQKRKTAHLQLLIDALQAINSSVECPNFIASDVKLLLEVLDLACMGIWLGGVLRLKLVL